jgi:acyl-CoA synthetase (AMP-forming)/AMP-acid ligase II
MFTAELELLQSGAVPYEGFQYLRTGIAAGSSIPAELMKKLHSTLNLTELSMYRLSSEQLDIMLIWRCGTQQYAMGEGLPSPGCGRFSKGDCRMTETSPVSAMTTTDDPLVKRVDSVGRLLPHVEYVCIATSIY